MKLGKNMKNLLGFAEQYPGWHSIASDRSTKNAIKGLADLGLIEVNEYSQFKYIDQHQVRLEY